MNTKTENEIRLENLKAELDMAKLTNHVLRQAWIELEIKKIEEAMGEK